MKKTILSLVIFGVIAFKATAQEAFSANGFHQKLGKTGTLCDTVYGVKVISDTLTRLNMGGSYPHQKYTIVVKGNKITLDYANLKGKQLCVTGVFLMYKGKPQIEIAEPEQINVK